jgi:hypothetical protein
MRELGEKELIILKKMVLSWKESYMKMPYPNCEKDLMEEIEESILPYLRNLYENGYIDEFQINEFMNFCYEQVEELYRSINKKLEV